MVNNYKFKEINKDIINLYLFPITYPKYKAFVSDEIINSDKVAKIVESELFILRNNLSIVHVMGKDYKKLYKELKDDGIVFEHKKIKTVENEYEIIFMINSEIPEDKIRGRYKVFITIIKTSRGVKQKIINTIDDSFERFFNNYLSDRFYYIAKMALFKNFFSDYDNGEKEYVVINALKDIGSKVLDIAIKNSNSKFIKTYTDYYNKEGYLAYRWSFVGANKIDYLLQNVDINILKDLDYNSALKLYYKD